MGAVVFDEDTADVFTYNEPGDAFDGYAIPTQCGVREIEDGKFEIATGIGSYPGTTAASVNDLLAFGLAALSVVAERILPVGQIPDRAVLPNRLPVEQLDMLRAAYEDGFRRGWDEETTGEAPAPIAPNQARDGLRGAQLDAAAEWGFSRRRASATDPGDAIDLALVRAVNEDRDQLVLIVRDHRPAAAAGTQHDLRRVT